jgi:hypothetical protein
MAGLVPAIHVFRTTRKKDVDARHKAGHDESWTETIDVISQRIKPRAAKTLII